MEIKLGGCSISWENSHLPGIQLDPGWIDAAYIQAVLANGIAPVEHAYAGASPPAALNLNGCRVN
jgi:hypothetical protein